LRDVKDGVPEEYYLKHVEMGGIDSGDDAFQVFTDTFELKDRESG
jgi:hypothetical protein